MRGQNPRVRALAVLLGCALCLAAVLALGLVYARTGMPTDFGSKNLPPSLMHPFGTDWLGRDMFARSLAGMALSICLGLLTATLSALVALALGAFAALLGPRADGFVTWITDLVMGIPHILLLLLISFACGRGFLGVTVGVTCTHWMSLARVLRGEMLQLRESGYVRVASRLGAGKLKILTRHMLPHLLPQFATGLLLLFPHAILHEASITFLGFGLPPETPAIGVILSESLRYLVAGQWWLAVLPGALLVAVVLLFEALGSAARVLLRASGAQA